MNSEIKARDFLLILTSAANISAIVKPVFSIAPVNNASFSCQLEIQEIFSEQKSGVAATTIPSRSAASHAPG